jgi:hypothetical protein
MARMTKTRTGTKMPGNDTHLPCLLTLARRPFLPQSVAPKMSYEMIFVVSKGLHQIWVTPA